MLKETSSASRITWRSVKHAKAVCTLIAPIVVNTLCSRQSQKHQYTMYQTLGDDGLTETTRNWRRWSNALQQKLPTKRFKQSALQEHPQSILREALKANTEAQKLVRIKPTHLFFVVVSWFFAPLPSTRSYSDLRRACCTQYNTRLLAHSCQVHKVIKIFAQPTTWAPVEQMIKKEGGGMGHPHMRLTMDGKGGNGSLTQVDHTNKQQEMSAAATLGHRQNALQNAYLRWSQSSNSIKAAPLWHQICSTFFFFFLLQQTC